MYKYKCKIIEVYDADTVTAEIFLGFDISVKMKLRLLGIDTPELRTKNLEEKEFGYAARDYVGKMILGKDVYIHSFKQGKFGRYLVNIYLDIVDIKSLNEILIEKGYALAYHGEKKSQDKMLALIKNYRDKK